MTGPHQIHLEGVEIRAIERLQVLDSPPCGSNTVRVSDRSAEPGSMESARATSGPASAALMVWRA